MKVRNMTKDECLKLLERSRLAKLACCHENQPYVVPVYLAYDSTAGHPCLYGFTTPGQKVEWMRTNPLVCVEVDEVKSLDDWVSVVVYGRYEELPERPAELIGQSPSHSDQFGSGTSASTAAPGPLQRQRAYEILQSYAAWWEPAAATRAEQPVDRQFTPTFYMVHIDEVTGHSATHDSESI